MASNLKSARQAIEPELDHARQGAAYYAARVEALETALQQLDSVEGDSAASLKGAANAGGMKRSAVHGRRRAHAASNGTGNGNGSARTRAGVAKRGRKTGAAAGAKRSGSTLSTSGDFWLSLVSEEPRSAVDIANAAIETLGIQPDQKAEIQKLKQRVSPALAGLVSAHKINDSGAGRERRFFKGVPANTH